MLTKKEIIPISLIILILSFTVSLIRSWTLFYYSLLSIFLIVLVNILAKKIASFYLDSEIEIKLWQIKRYGFKPNQNFKRPFPTGAFFPILLTAISFGYLTWMASLTFEVKPKVYRAAKRHGLYSFSEMTESHIGLIAAAGIFATLGFAVLGYFIGLPEIMNFVNLSILYAFYNMIPISDLDGNKIFFGNKILWSFLATITLIGVGYILLIV
jgi:hypothetical protein